MECVLNDQLARKYKSSKSHLNQVVNYYPLHGRFHYGSFITIPLLCGQIFLISPILLDIENCIEDA